MFSLLTITEHGCNMEMQPSPFGGLAVALNFDRFAPFYLVPYVLTSKVDSSKIFINEPVKGRKERKKWY